MSKLERAYEDSARVPAARVGRQSRRARRRARQGDPARARSQARRAGRRPRSRRWCRRTRGPALLVPPSVRRHGAAGARGAARAAALTLALVSNTMRTPGTVLRTLLARAGLARRASRTRRSPTRSASGSRRPRSSWTRCAAWAARPRARCTSATTRSSTSTGARAAGLRAVQVVGREREACRDRAGSHDHLPRRAARALASLEAGVRVRSPP